METTQGPEDDWIRDQANAVTGAGMIPLDRLREVRAWLDLQLETAVPWNEAREALSLAVSPVWE